MPDDDASASTLAVAPSRALHSDPHDFAGLYVRHRAPFTAHARRYLRDQRDADEVVQEAFLRLFLALPELDTELQALAYCRRTITNLCIDRYRAQARRPYLVDLDTAHVEDLADDDPGDPVVRAEDAALVRTALSLLSPLQRAALVKREVEDKSLPVIAGELDIPEDNVKHLLFRARRALRKLLAGSSLAPGADAEAHGLGLSAKAGSRSLATLLVLLVLGLGSGPNLESIPVVGVDLPDVIGVTEMAESLRGVVTEVGEKIAPSGGAGTSPVGAGRLESALLMLSAPLTDDADEAAGSQARVGSAARGTSAALVAQVPGSVQHPTGPSQRTSPSAGDGPSSATASDAAAARGGTPAADDVPTAGTRPSRSDAGSTPGSGGEDVATAPGSGALGQGPVAAGPQRPATGGMPQNAAPAKPGRASPPKPDKPAKSKPDKPAKSKPDKVDKAKPDKVDKPTSAKGASKVDKPKAVPAPVAPVEAAPAPAQPAAAEPAVEAPAATGETASATP